MTTSIDNKPVVAVYTQRYLNPTMTFVYRQIKSVMNEFNPIILTPNRIQNLSLFPYENIYSKRKNISGILYRRFKKATGGFAVLSKQQNEYFKNILIENQAGIIHAHFGPSGIEIEPLARRLNIPLLTSFHGYDASSLLNNPRYISDLKVLFKYAEIIAVSNYMAGKLISVGANPDRLNVVYYGIDVEKFPFISRISIAKKIEQNNTIKFLQISNFAEKKGHKYTILAFAELLKNYNYCKLTLTGSGEKLDDSKKLCSELGISKNVYFPGILTPDKVNDAFKEADIFLHHSITAQSGDQEGIPNVIMEAMSTGLPVISTYHAGIPELISDGVNGFLVKEKDINGYVKTMEKALDSSDELIRNARQTIVQNFNIDNQTKKLCELYRKFLK
jgi:glycosyltransferase involved in cell wall biosynthesis